MAFELNKESYTGAIKEISIGKGAAALTVGGETCYPFYTFEGDMPNKPVIAIETKSIAQRLHELVVDVKRGLSKFVEQFDVVLL